MALASAAANGQSDTRLITLENGLTIIVREDHSAPVVSAQAWCRTGSIHEGAWMGAGLSHILEHMLFKGTEKRGAGRIDQEVQEAGGYMNAYTSFDRTVYYIDVPNDGTVVAIDILCDILQHASLPADELAKELDVIRREIAMGHDDPGQRSSRRLFETAYTTSPYRYTVIGYPDIFNELKREDIVHYYRHRYVPNNVFLVIVGDVDTTTVVEQIKTAFAGSKARALPPIVLPAEPRQTAPREVIEEAAIQQGHLHYSWHVPGLRHPDMPALDVLATVLGGGRSSRLYQNVREKKGVVNSADAWTYTPTDMGIFGISAVVDADKFDAAREALLAELDQIRTQPVPAAELEKVVKQFVAATLATRKTMQGQAQTLGGSWSNANDLGFAERHVESVKRVTPADLLRVARDYLTEDNRTLYALLPQGQTPRAAAIIVRADTHPVQKYELPNGLRLLVKEDHRLPFVQLRAIWEGGVLAESEAQSGVTQFMSKLMLKGTDRRTGQQIAEQIESVGGHINSFAGGDNFGVTMEVMSGDLPLGLDIFSDVILHPSFPDAALERQRQVQLAAIKSQNDRLLQSAARLARETLFGARGYGLSVQGKEASVKSLDRADVVSYHRRLTVPNNAVFAVYGDVRPDAVRAEFEKAFGLWRRGADFTRPVPPALSEGMQRVDQARDKEQAVVLIVYAGCTLFDKERLALDVLSEACSDLGSRLFLRIREQLGMAYYVGAQNQPGLIPGTFFLYAGTAPEHAARVEQELLAEAAALREAGLTEEELHRAKNKMLGQRKIARQDLGHLAGTAAVDELHGLGHDYQWREDVEYAAVTVEDTRRAAQQIFRPAHCVSVVLHPTA